jgi:hypothetical protein
MHLACGENLGALLLGMRNFTYIYDVDCHGFILLSPVPVALAAPDT